MSSKLRRRIPTVLVATAAVTLTLHIESQPVIAVTPDEVINWNVIAISVGSTAGKSGNQQSRIYAMVQIAVHDALNAIEHRYTSYTYAPAEDPTDIGAGRHLDGRTRRARRSAATAGCTD